MLFLLNKSNIKMSFFSTLPAHKSRMSRRRSTAERAEAPEALNCDTDASQTTRLEELLLPTICREPPSVKPTPPTWPKVRGRSSSNTSGPSPPISTLEQSEASARDCIPLKKRESASGRSRTHASLQKHRNRKEQISEKAFVKDQTASLPSNSSLERKQPSRRVQAGNHTITREQQDGEQLRRNEAACIIQRAWHRFVPGGGRPKMWVFFFIIKTGRPMWCPHVSSPTHMPPPHPTSYYSHESSGRGRAWERGETRRQGTQRPII